jgi:hypothetical protein
MKLAILDSNDVYSLFSVKKFHEYSKPNPN